MRACSAFFTTALWLACLCFRPIALHAQDPESNKSKRKPFMVPPFSVGVGLAATWYSGDLRTNSPYAGLHAAVWIQGRKRVQPGFQIGLGSFAAEDRSLPMQQGIQPNTFVQTSFWYGDLRLRLRFRRESHAIRPYLCFGWGILTFTPTDREGNPLASQPETRGTTESYVGSTAYIPLGLGTTYRFSQLLTFSLELNRMFAFTPYLDNINKLGRTRTNDALNNLQTAVHFRIR